MRVAAHQPNYLPWAGYFAKAAAADLLVFLDDVDFPQGRSYVSRTKIGTDRGPAWLSAPVTRSSGMPIRLATFATADWADKHERTLRSEYARAPYFGDVWSVLEPVYGAGHPGVAAFNMAAVKAIAAYLELGCTFAVASELGSEGTSDDRLISLVRRVGGDCYVSGKGGQNYQDPAKFAAAGLELDVREHEPRPYRQVHRNGLFEAGLSFVDALFAIGQDARHLLT